MYDNNYISSSQDMHNYLDQLSGLQPVYRKNLSRSTKCEKQYTKPFRLSKISESSFSKRGYEREIYQKDKVIEWKKPKLDDNSEKIPKKCFQSTRDPRLKTTMVDPKIPPVNKPDRAIYDKYRVKIKKKEPMVQTYKMSGDKIQDYPGINKLSSKEREAATCKNKDSVLLRSSLKDPSEAEKTYSFPSTRSSKCNVNSKVSNCSEKPVNNIRRKSKSVKIKVFPPLSKIDYENIWNKKAKVVLSEIPCSIRKKYKLKLVNKTIGSVKHTISESIQTDLDFDTPSSVPDTSDSLEKHFEHPKQKTDRESFLSSMEKELDDTKKLTSPTYCESIWVDPKVMAMSSTLQRACDTKSIGSTLAFKLKKNLKSPEKRVMKKEQFFNLDKLRNSLQGSIDSSRHLRKYNSKVSQTVPRDRSKSDEKNNVDHHETLGCKDDLRLESRSTRLKQPDRDQETHAERKNDKRHCHKNQYYSKSEHRDKHHKSDHKPAKSTDLEKRSDSSTSSFIQYPQISSTNDPSTSLCDKDDLETTTSTTASIKKGKPPSRWDVKEKSNRQRKASEDKIDSKSQRSSLSLDMVSRIVSDSRAKQNMSTPLKSIVQSTLMIHEQDFPKTHENSLKIVSPEYKSNKIASSSEEKVGIVKIENYTTNIDMETNRHCSSNDSAFQENQSDRVEALIDNVVPEAPCDFDNNMPNSEGCVTADIDSVKHGSSSLELSTSVISPISPISSDFLIPEVNEIALESFVSEIEIETTVVEDTLLEHATVSCALVTQTPTKLNQIPIIEQSKTVVEKRTEGKVPLSEQILTDTSLEYGQTTVFNQKEYSSQTSATSYISPVVISKEIDEFNNEPYLEVIESVDKQTSPTTTDIQRENNDEAKLMDSEEILNIVSNISVDPCSSKISKNCQVIDQFIDTDQNDNSLKVSQKLLGNIQSFESTQNVSVSDNSSKVNEQKEISNSTNMVDLKVSTNAPDDVPEEIGAHNTNTDQLNGKLIVDTSDGIVGKPANEEFGTKPINREEYNTKEKDCSADTESSCIKEKNEDKEQCEKDSDNQQNQLIIDSLDIEYPNVLSAEESLQPVINGSDTNITPPQTLIYEDISNSSITECVSSYEANNILPVSTCNSEVAKDNSTQRENEVLVNRQSKPSTDASIEKEANPCIMLSSSVSNESNPSSINEPGMQQFEPVVAAQLSTITNLSVAKDSTSNLVEIKQLTFDDSSLKSGKDVNEPLNVSKSLFPKDVHANPDSTKDIQPSKHETANSQLIQDKTVDVLETVCQDDLPDSTSTICADSMSANPPNKGDSELNLNDVSIDMYNPESSPIASKVQDDESTYCKISLLSDLTDSQSMNYKLDDKKIFEISNAKSQNNIIVLPDLEIEEKGDQESRTVKEDTLKTVKLFLPNELDIANKKSFFEGCPLYFSNVSEFKEGMKLPVRIASNDFEEESKAQFRETVQKPGTVTIDVDNGCTKTLISTDTNVLKDHQPRDKTKLEEEAFNNIEGPVPVSNVIPAVSNMSNVCSSGIDHVKHTNTVITAKQFEPITRVKIAPSTPQTTKYGPYLLVPAPVNAEHDSVMNPMPQLLVVKSPLCPVIPSFQQTGNQRFVTFRPCSQYIPPGSDVTQTSNVPLATITEPGQPILIQTSESEKSPAKNAQINQNSKHFGPLTIHTSNLVSKPTSNLPPSFTQNYVTQCFSIAKPLLNVGPYSTQTDAGRHLAPTRTTNNFIPQSVATDSNIIPIVSVKQFDTILTSRDMCSILTEKQSTNVPISIGDSVEFGNVPSKNCEKQVILSSDNRQTVINGTNVVTFPLKLPEDAIASLTQTNSSLGTILKISETVQTSDQFSKLLDDKVVPQSSAVKKDTLSDKIINSESCSEQLAKAKPDIAECEEVSGSNSNISQETESTKDPDHKNSHIHISIPLSRIGGCHMPTVSIPISKSVNNPSPVASTSSVASSESSPKHFSATNDLSPPNLNPAIDLKNSDRNVQIVEEWAFSDSGSVNTDETQLWKKASSVEEIMSDETLIYSCDELEDIDQELKLNEKLKYEKQKILIVVQKLREELSENKMENNDTLIRKRRRSQVLESVDLKSIAETDPDIQTSTPGCSSEKTVLKVHKYHTSKQRQKIRKKRELDNEVLYDSDLDELPVIHPPKRRRLQKLNMQETAIRSNLDSDRIRLELPLHNWLEHKIKLGTESSKSSGEEVQDESDSNNGTSKRKSKNNAKKDVPGSPETISKVVNLVTKSKDKEPDTFEINDMKTKETLPDVLPENSTNASTFDQISPVEKPDVWRKQLSLSRLESHSETNVSNGTDNDVDINKMQTVEDEQANNIEVQVPVLSVTPSDESPQSLKSEKDVNTNASKNPLGDGLIASNLDKDDEQLVDEHPTSQKNSDQNVSSSQEMLETDIKTEENAKPKLELPTPTERTIEVEKSNPSEVCDDNLATNDANQPLDLCLKVSQDNQIKSISQKPQPKVQLVHPQVISSTAKKKEEHTSLAQATKMAIESITSTKVALQNDQNSSIEASNAANQESQPFVTPQAEVCDFSMKKSNMSVPSQIPQQNHESNANICLPATSDEESHPVSSKKLPDDLEFQHHIEELRHLERLARKKEQEHAQVLAMSRKKVETIMKLKLQKKRAAALNISSVTFDKEHDVQLCARNSSPGSSASSHLSPNTVTENDFAEKNCSLVYGKSAGKTEKGENFSINGDHTATSNDSPSQVYPRSNNDTSKENKSEDMKTMTGQITEALQQAVQNKTIKNPNLESDKQITPQPAHQREKSTLPHDEPYKLPNDASSMCPFRLRSSVLTDPSIEPSKKSTDKMIQVAHNQPAFQPAGSLIVPNLPNSHKGNSVYNFSGMSESNKSRALEYKRSQTYNKEELGKAKGEVIDLTVESLSVLNDPPPLKRIRRSDIMEMPFRQNKSPLNNQHVPYDESTSRQVLRSPNQRLIATSNGQEVVQPVPRYQLKASPYSHSPPVYQQNMVPPSASPTSPIQNSRLQYDRNSPYSRGASPHTLYPMRPGMSNPLIRLQNVQTYNSQIRPEQQTQKPVNQGPFPAIPQNNPYGHLEPGEIITNRFSRGWHPSHFPPATNPHMPDVTDRRVFPGQHALPSHVLNKQIMAQHLLQQPIPRIPSEHSHNPNGGPGPYRASVPNTTQKIFSPHGMAQPLQDSINRPNEIQQPYSGSQPRPVASIVENNRACCVCNKVSCFICSGCRKVWYCSHQCQNANWKVHSQYCKKS